MIKYPDAPGKSLSKLQKNILAFAYCKTIGKTPGEATISNREVLAKVYGFKPMKDIETSKKGSLVFDRKMIGIKQYNSASVVVVNSFNRLHRRGLATWMKGNEGIVLTGKGVEVAEWLNTTLDK